ncbi:MAG: potassium transporter [Oxalobacteraceae bacterium]|nr:potassium transporter [Oxalobacteraceae bacterium]
MHSALELTLILLIAAVLGVVAFRMLQLPPMLGYLTVGVLIGPHALGLASQSATTHTLAEFGVVFLMFSIGLEFSLPKLKAMRRNVFGLGTAQVGLTILMSMAGVALLAPLLPQYFDMSLGAAFAIGGALSMSSTAIVLKLLTEKLELESEHGRRITAILLFQDLALVPLLILIPALGKPGADMVEDLGMAALKAVFVLALLLSFGQVLLRRWFQIVVQRRSQELFMLNLLLITLGAAWVTEVAGLSLALGAFIAGMLISETEYRLQVEEDIKPFRDVLLGLFFISVGMMLDMALVFNNLLLVVALLVIPFVLKFGLIAIVARWFGAPSGVAIRTGLGLAQGGEFGFVLLNQAGALKLIDPGFVQLILAAMVLSMLATPFVLANADRIVMRLSRNEWMQQSLAITSLAARTMSDEKHVIIAGFGRTGQSIAKVLEEEKILYHALDLDPQRVQEAQAAGANVSYGDTSRRESLIAAGIHRAAVLVVTYADTQAALKTLHFANELAPTLPAIVRSIDDTDIEKLRAGGADEVVPETIESSLMLASQTLLMLGVPLSEVVQRAQRVRGERYASLRGYFHGQGDVPDDEHHLQVRLHSVPIRERAAAIGREFSELALSEEGAEVTAVRRGKSRLAFSPDLRLEAGDVVVLRGTAEAIERAEKRLL